MRSDLRAQLERALQEQTPHETRFSVNAVDLAPEGERAGALVTPVGASAPALQVFFDWDGSEWVVRGEVVGLGPGGWDFGDFEYPVLAGRVQGGGRVELACGRATVVRPVGDQGYYLGVFWELAQRSEPAAPAAPGFTASIRWEDAGGDEEPPCPRLVRQLGPASHPD